MQNAKKTIEDMNVLVVVTGNQEASEQDEAAVSGIGLKILDVTVTFPVCPHCRSTRLRLIKEIPQRKNEMKMHVA